MGLQLIRDAVPKDAEILSDLAMRSKAYWGYSAEFMSSCKEELSVSSDNIMNADYHCCLVEKKFSVIGFYSLENLSISVVELEALFVEPCHIGTGVGKVLIDHAIERAKKIGANTMIIQADPNAKSFYLKAGAKLTGELASLSIPGRLLPTFEIEL